MKITCRRPFTLVEMLVVVSVIAVLAAILLPALNKAKRMAYRASCTSNLRQINVGQLMYADEQDQWAPQGVETTTPSGYYSATLDEWFDAYFSDTRIFRCPAEGRPNPKMTSNRPESYGGRRWDPAVISSYYIMFGLGNYYKGGQYDYWWGWRSRQGPNMPLPRLSFVDSRQSYKGVAGVRTFLMLPADEMPMAYDGLDLSRADLKYQVLVPYDPGKTWWKYREASHAQDRGNTYSYADGHVAWKQYPSIKKVAEIGEGNTTVLYW